MFIMIVTVEEMYIYLRFTTSPQGLFTVSFLMVPMHIICTVTK